MTLRRRECVSALGLLALGASSGRVQAQAAPAAAPAEVAQALPGARLQGQATLRFLGLHVYDARLWVAATPVPAEGDWAAAPLALELQYARALKGALIAERSLKEMRRQGEIDAPSAERWLGAMTQLFPDVKAGERLTGVLVPGAGVRFFHDARLVGDQREAAFARRFFGIWLAPQTSEPALRRSLLGLA
jgi:hypothetical protein